MRTMRTGTRLALTAVIGLCLISPLAAQSGKDKDQKLRSVQGIVSDAQENPLAKAVVQLKNTKTLQVKSFYTDDKGAYRFFGLDPNQDYELRAEYGSASGVRTVSSFDSRREMIVNFKLDVKK